MYALKLHPNLNSERWAQFPRSKQILMIANEVNRLRNAVKTGQSHAAIQETFERAFELVDLTVECGSWSLRKELLRWRELFADLYTRDENEMNEVGVALDQLYRVLLQMSGESADLVAIRT